MIRKILLFPIRVIRAFLMGIGVIVFITVGICDFFLEKRERIDPIKYSSDGKVVDLDDFRAN